MRRRGNRQQTHRQDCTPRCQLQKATRKVSTVSREPVLKSAAVGDSVMNQVRTQPRKIKPSSKANARSIAALDQNRKPTNNVDNAIVIVATGMIGWPKYTLGSGAGPYGLARSLIARGMRGPSQQRAGANHSDAARCPVGSRRRGCGQTRIRNEQFNQVM